MLVAQPGAKADAQGMLVPQVLKAQPIYQRDELDLEVRAGSKELYFIADFENPELARLGWVS